MLRAAATVVALLAALPAVTPLLGGYRAFSECRNLTHLGPGKWPDFSSKLYNYTGLLVMTGDTCSGALVSPRHFLSNSMCRLWKENVDFTNDTEEDGSEVRIGIIQGQVSEEHYVHQRVKHYFHWGKSTQEVLKNPVMLAEVFDDFFGVEENILPGIFHDTPFANGSEEFVVGEVVGYEHTVNLPLYHQSVIDAHFYKYHDHCKQYGRTEWDLPKDAFCTWDVSPVRTVCHMDRGAPVYYKKHILGFVVGIVDDMKAPSKYCGTGRIHYNVFMLLRNYTNWIRKVTDSKAKIFNLEGGRPVEDCLDIDEPEVTVPPAKRPATKRPRKKPGKARGGAGQLTIPPGPLLLAAVATVARLASQD